MYNVAVPNSWSLTSNLVDGLCIIIPSAGAENEGDTTTILKKFDVNVSKYY